MQKKIDVTGTTTTGPPRWQRLYLASALSAPSRHAHARRSLSQSDRGLGDPPPDLPAGSQEFAASVDLPVTGRVAATRILSLPEVHLSGVEREFRSEVREAMASSFSASADPVLTERTRRCCGPLPTEMGGEFGVSALPMTI